MVTRRACQSKEVPQENSRKQISNNISQHTALESNKLLQSFAFKTNAVYNNFSAARGSETRMHKYLAREREASEKYTIREYI